VDRAIESVCEDYELRFKITIDYSLASYVVNEDLIEKILRETINHVFILAYGQEISLSMKLSHNKKSINIKICNPVSGLVLQEALDWTFKHPTRLAALREEIESCYSGTIIVQSHPRLGTSFIIALPTHIRKKNVAKKRPHKATMKSPTKKPSPDHTSPATVKQTDLIKSAAYGVLFIIRSKLGPRLEKLLRDNTLRGDNTLDKLDAEIRNYIIQGQASENFTSLIEEISVKCESLDEFASAFNILSRALRGEPVIVIGKPDVCHLPLTWPAPGFMLMRVEEIGEMGANSSKNIDWEL